MTEIAVPLARDPWEKQKGESVQAFASFAHYRDLGPTRSLAKAAADLGKSSRTLEEQSQKYGWAARIEAWTLYQDRREREAREDAVDEMNRRHETAGQLMTGAGLTRFAGRRERTLEDGTVVPALAALDPADLSPEVAARLVVDGQRVERLARGLPTDFTKGISTYSAEEVTEIVGEVVDRSLARIPEDEAEAFLLEIREIGRRRRG